MSEHRLSLSEQVIGTAKRNIALPVVSAILQAASWTVGGVSAMLLVWGKRFAPADIHLVLAWVFTVVAFIPPRLVYRALASPGIYAQLTLNIALTGYMIIQMGSEHADGQLFSVVVSILYTFPLMNTIVYLLGTRLIERAKGLPNQAL